MISNQQTGNERFMPPAPASERMTSRLENWRNSNLQRYQTRNGCFKPIRPHVYILRGSLHQGDALFSRYSRNRQCTAIACVAIVYLNLQPIQEWNDTDVDTILSAGDSYYTQCREMIEPDNIYLNTDELLPSLSIREKPFTIDLGIDVVVGLISPSNDVPQGFFGSLRSGVKKFFQLHSRGILTCETAISISIFRVERFYYVFDSHSRGPKGHPAYKHGKSTVLQFKNMTDLIKHLPVALMVRKRHVDLQYSITAVSCTPDEGC